MAGPYYVRSSDGDDGDSGLSWALAKATFGAAVALAAAGERIYVDDGHQETLAANTTYTFAGTEGNPVEVIVVTTDTTAAVSNYNSSNQYIEGDTNNKHISFAGHAHLWGICLKVGAAGYYMVATGSIIMENSNLQLRTTGYAGITGSAHPKLMLINSDLYTDGTYFLLSLGTFIWRGGILTGDPDKIISFWTSGGYVEIIGVDLSSMVGGAILDLFITNAPGYSKIKGVKLNATPPIVLTSGEYPAKESEYLMDITDNGNTVYKFRREFRFGYAQDETTKVITGKALYDGTNEFTAKMVSRATPPPTFYDPWRYHLTTLRETGFAASRTYTVHIAQDHASVQPDALDDDEIWLEVVYPDDTTAQYNIKTDKIATPTTTPAAQTTSTETWEGLLSTTRLQELSVQIDAADGKNGPVEIWVCLAKEDTTVYVCPEVYVS